MARTNVRSMSVVIVLRMPVPEGLCQHSENPDKGMVLEISFSTSFVWTLWIPQAILYCVWETKPPSPLIQQSHRSWGLFISSSKSYPPSLGELRPGNSKILGAQVSLRSRIKRRDGGGTPSGIAKSRAAQHTYRSTKSRTSIERGVYWNGGSCDNYCCYTAGVEVQSAKGVRTGRPFHISGHCQYPVCTAVLDLG